MGRKTTDSATYAMANVSPGTWLHFCCHMLELGLVISCYHSFMVKDFCMPGALGHTLSVWPLAGWSLDIHFLFCKRDMRDLLQGLNQIKAA